MSCNNKARQDSHCLSLDSLGFFFVTDHNVIDNSDNIKPNTKASPCHVTAKSIPSLPIPDTFPLLSTFPFCFNSCGSKQVIDLTVKLNRDLAFNWRGTEQRFPVLNPQSSQPRPSDQNIHSKIENPTLNCREQRCLVLRINFSGRVPAHPLVLQWQKDVAHVKHSKRHEIFTTSHMN